MPNVTISLTQLEIDAAAKAGGTAAAFVKEVLKLSLQGLIRNLADQELAAREGESAKDVEALARDFLSRP